MNDDAGLSDYLDILVVCSAPVDISPALNLIQELSAFENEVRNATLPIRLKRVFPPTFAQLERELTPRALRSFRPRVFHFLGHGEEDGLIFETERGTHERISPARIKRLLGGADSPIELAILNACWSGTDRMLSVCKHLIQAPSPIRAAIGHAKPVADESAIHFAKRFYELLIDGQRIGKACERAANLLAGQGLPGFTDIQLEGDGDYDLAHKLRAGERQGQVLSGLPERYSLPAPDYFCGRAEEFGKAVAALEDNELTGFGIWGIGGMGKTALAKELAQRNAWRYRNGGVAFVDIRDLPESERSVVGLLRRALARLDPSSTAADLAAELLQRLQQQGAGLIVLDNLEDLPATEHAALARFVRAIPRNGSKAVITARARLQAFEELPTARTLDLTRGLDDWNGAHYAFWVAQKREIKALADERPRLDAGRVEGRCAWLNRQLSGHPKMLEVAVGIARKGMPALENALKDLRGELEGQVRALLASGLALVGAEGRRLWAYLPLFPSGQLLPEALAAVIAAENCRAADGKPTDASQQWIETGLQQLERAAFLDFDQDARLYHFHQSVLEHAQCDSPLADAQRASADLALVAFYANYLAENRNHYPAIDRCFVNALALMEALWAAHAAGELAAELKHALMLMTDALGYYLIQRGLWQHAQRWLERNIELHGSSPITENSHGLAHALYRQAMLLHGQGNPAEARRRLQCSLEVYESLGDRQGLAASLHQLAIIEAEQGNPAEARQLLQRSMKINETLSNCQGFSASLYQLASIEFHQGNPAEARQFLQCSMKTNESLDDRQGLAASLHLLAIIEEEQGNSAEARRLLQCSLEIKEDQGDRQGLAASLHRLASIEARQGNPAEARRLLQRSLEILENLNNRQGLAASFHLLASIEAEQGNPAEARRLLQRSLETYESLGDRRGLAASLHQLAIIEAEQDNPVEATRLWNLSISIKEQIGDAIGRASSHTNLRPTKY
ncbi:MAG: tetratricopeptide repeat protein [Gammaproteobacteria bacterium]